MDKTKLFLFIAVIFSYLAISVILAQENYAYTLSYDRLVIEKIYSSNFDMTFRYNEESVFDCINKRAFSFKLTVLECEDYSLYNLRKFILDNPNNFIIVTPNSPDSNEVSSITKLKSVFNVQETVPESSFISSDKNFIFIGTPEDNSKILELTGYSSSFENSPLFYIIQENQSIKVIITGKNTKDVLNMTRFIENRASYFNSLKSSGVCRVIAGCEKPFYESDTDFNEQISNQEILNFLDIQNRFNQLRIQKNINFWKSQIFPVF